MNKFDYSKSEWQSPEAERWLKALESIGPENVRAILASAYRDIGSRAAVGIGSALDVTKGFAQEWLAWHDAQKAEREQSFRRQQLLLTGWAATAATVAGLAACPWLGLDDISLNEPLGPHILAAFAIVGQACCARRSTHKSAQTDLVERFPLLHQQRQRSGHRYRSAMCQQPTHASQQSVLFNHLVSGRENFVGHCEAECLRGREVDDQFELGGSVDRQISWFNTSE